MNIWPEDIKKNKLEEKANESDQRLFSSGIYFLLKDEIVVYVGKANMIASRICDHYKNATKDFDDFKFINCEAKYLDLLESYFIYKYIPLFNKQLGKYNKVWQRIETIPIEDNQPVSANNYSYRITMTVDDLETAKNILKYLNVQEN